jgi:hypothetical protein
MREPIAERLARLGRRCPSGEACVGAFCREPCVRERLAAQGLEVKEGAVRLKAPAKS